LLFCGIIVFHKHQANIWVIMGDVSVIYGTKVLEMVRRLFDETGALNRLQPDDRVVIKPNLVVSRKKWSGLDTDPRVVEAIVILLKEAGIRRITVGDGSGMGYSATKAFEYCGYNEIADHYGLKLVDLERDKFIKKPVSIDGPFRYLEIARTVIECDFFINVPIMKAHGQTLMTCSLKNLKGTMPRAMKTAFHGVNLDLAIAQLNSILTPDLIVVDGLKGDLHSETGHDPVPMDRIILGTDPVEVDSVAADMLGYDPGDIRHIAYSINGDPDSHRFEKINIRTLNRPSKPGRFSPPEHYTKRYPCRVIDTGACCTCMGNLIYALERLYERGVLSNRQVFLVGQKPMDMKNSELLTIAVGQCATKTGQADILIQECPPSASRIIKGVYSGIQDEK
jgi:uncharacterized protein (DUF362 family)